MWVDAKIGGALQLCYCNWRFCPASPLTQFTHNIGLKGGPSDDDLDAI